VLIDAILFNGEWDILDIRLGELCQVVGKFVIVESAEYHGSNRKKEPRVYGYDCPGLDIHYVYLDHLEPPFAPETSWLRENYHRNAIWHEVMKLDPGWNDVLMLSDADEIPSASGLAGRAFETTRLYGTCQDMFYYNVNNYTGEWHGTVMGTIEAFSRNGSLQDARNKRDEFERIPDCGWHFSYFGGLERIRHKAENFAHANEPICTELKQRPDEEVLKDIAEGRDLYHRPGQQSEKRSSCDPRLPRYFLENRERFRNLWTT
jgi:beta-1,4-mannosyl-glycoprotein beta-1,4-N-acetylglucosaminyltransferase